MADLLGTVRAQEAALRTIDYALETERIHHAYLFVGPDGVGKELAAFGLAQALVCERRSPDANAGGGLFGAVAPLEPKSYDSHDTSSRRSLRRVRACGTCSACQRAVPREDGRPVHPDVVVIARGIYTPQSIGRRTAETQDISIDQIRTLVLARSAFAPHEGRAKVFIIRQADELSISAANALLKTLEEPGQRTHFILLTSQPEALLPTILSRTQRVRFAPLPDDVVEALLVESGVEPARAAEVTRLAGGSVEAGILLADPEESEARDRFIASALAATATPGIEAVLALAEAAKKEKDRLPAYIAGLAAKLAADAAESARAGRSDAEAIAIRGRHALTALEHLAGNGAAQLVVEAMLTRMRAL